MKRSRSCVHHSPFFGVDSVLIPIALVDLCYLWGERVVRVWICHEGADRQEYFLNGHSRRPPFLLENIQTDLTSRVDVRVVYLGYESHFGRVERIVLRELDVKIEGATLIL